jgi:hypothetical protein
MIFRPGIITAVEGWQMTLDGAVGEAKTVKLGSFAAMGIPENAKALFRRTIDIPKDWQGRRINLCFRAKWSFGVIPLGRLWINGELAKIRQPLRPSGDVSFTVPVSDLAKGGRLELALEVDGAKPLLDKEGRRSRPSGDTGAF